MDSFVLDADSLAEDEIIYELKLRGVSVAAGKSEIELRGLLRPLLKLESSQKSLHYPTNPINVDEELTALETKLLGLDLNLSAHDTTNVLGLQHLRGRVYHVLKRINRIRVDELTAEQVTARSDCLARALSLLDRLDLLCGDTDSVPDTARVDFAHLFDSTRVPIASSGRAQPVAKWQLKFSGDPRGISVHNFLERVNELRVARGVSEHQLFESAIDLFEGRALQWYRCNRQRFTCWTSLSDLLVKHYEPPDYRPRLFEDILSRTQDPHESFVDYFSCMLAMMRRHGGIGDEMQLDILTRNLAPFYTMQLPTVSTLAQLEDECLKLEKKKHRADHYRPPSRKRGSYVEPDLACVSANPLFASEYFSSESQSSPVVNAVQSDKIKCYNCDQLGHAFRSCPAPKRIFCYRCGEVGVTSRTCSRCSGNFSGSR